MKTLYTAIQPTGTVHLGNYLGSILPFINMTEKMSSDAISFMALADIHATTLPYNPRDLSRSCLDMTKILIACGVSQRTHIYRQSSLPGHFMLSKIIEHMSRVGELERMTQYKSKSDEDVDSIPLGLLTYPALMASDIMLFGSNFVPVGDDQTQHLEFTRTLIKRFNKKMKPKRQFPIPVSVGLSGVGRVMSLSEPEKKMSKSSPCQNGVLYLTDDSETVKYKIRKAVSSSLRVPIPDSHYEKTPAIENLLTLYSALSSLSKKETINRLIGLSNSEIKDNLYDVYESKISPIRKQIEGITDEEAITTLRSGHHFASDHSQPFLEQALFSAGF